MPRVLRPNQQISAERLPRLHRMRMEWGKCRADTRSSHTQHVRRIALDTEREGRAPCPIRPPADPRLDTDLPTHDLQTMHLAHVHRASRRGRPVERDSKLSLRPRADRRSRRCRRKVEGATPRAHLRTRGSVSAGRWSAVGAEEGAGHRSPAQAAASGPERGGAAPPPRRPRAASLRGGGHRPLPTHLPFPPDLDLRRT